MDQVCMCTHTHTHNQLMQMDMVYKYQLVKGLCWFLQVLDKDVDLRTVKYSIWKSSGDIRLFYREVDPLPKTSADDGDSPKATSSKDGKDEKQKEETQEDGEVDSKVVNHKEEMGTDGGEQDKMEVGEEKQLVAVMDGEEETNDQEKMDEDKRTEEEM